MKFVVGDRVRAYTGDLVYTGKVQITWAVAGTSLLPIQLDNGATLYFHPKQCRKLVKKPRRSVWIAENAAYDARTASYGPKYFIATCVSDKFQGPAWVEFVEKRPLKRGKK